MAEPHGEARGYTKPYITPSGVPQHTLGCRERSWCGTSVWRLASTLAWQCSDPMPNLMMMRLEDWPKSHGACPMPGLNSCFVACPASRLNWSGVSM